MLQKFSNNLAQLQYKLVIFVELWCHKFLFWKFWKKNNQGKKWWLYLADMSKMPKLT